MTLPLNQPARVPRELKQGFQVQEGWCQGRSTQSASGADAPSYSENLDKHLLGDCASPVSSNVICLFTSILHWRSDQSLIEY